MSTCSSCLKPKPQDPARRAAEQRLKQLEAEQTKLEQRLAAVMLEHRRLTKKLGLPEP